MGAVTYKSGKDRRRRNRMKTLVFTEREVEVIQLALKVLITTTKGENISASIVEGLAKRLQEYAEEQFASVHSQGG
jgi:hypothetical protein